MAKAKRDLTNPQVQGPPEVDPRGDGNPPYRDPAPRRLLTIEETAEDPSTVSVRNGASRSTGGRLSIVKVGRLVGVEQSELEAFIDRGRSARRCGSGPHSARSDVSL